MVFVIKRLNYIEFRVFWKEKNKGELEVQEARIGYSQFRVLCRDREGPSQQGSLALCRDRVIHVAIELLG